MKKIICFLCSLMLAAYSVSASVVPQNQNEDTVIISGNADVGEGEKVTVTVFPHGESFDSENAVFGSPSEIPSYVNVAYAGSGGAFSVQWTVGKSGFYDVYISADGKIASKEEKVYIPSGAKVIYDKVRSGSANDIKDVLSENDGILKLLRNESNANAVSAQNLADAIFNIRQSYEGTDTEVLVNAAKSVAVLASEKSADGLDAALSALKDAGISLPFAGNYSTYATPEIKAEMALTMSGICQKTVSQMADFFADSLILAGVYKSPNWMDGVDFLKILGYPSGEEKINKAANAVTGNKYDTVADLKSAIDAALGTPSGGGGTGGSGSGSGGGGGFTPSGTGGSSGGTIDVGTIDTGIKQNEIFNDVISSHYAFDDINYLRWHQVVSGDEKGNFNPDLPITRAEVVKMLCGVFGIENSEITSFNDVDRNSWYAGFIGGAYNAGLLKGGNDGNFYPETDITRQDLAVMIYRFYEYSGNVLQGGNVSFADRDAISEYALSAVSALSANGIINGTSENTFLPFDSASRAQTACMLARCMRSLGKGGI